MARKKELTPFSGDGWQTVGRPGYQGKNKDESISRWNEEYGVGKWRLAWELSNGEFWDYDQVFWQVYVPGYVRHFILNPDQASFLSQNYSYVYDKDSITRQQAFDPHALYMVPGIANQFHHVSLNIALEHFIGVPFQGRRPLRVREGKPGTPPEKQPEGYLWSPGRIASVRPELIPKVELDNVWWQKGSIEDLYQSGKVLQIRE